MLLTITDKEKQTLGLVDCRLATRQPETTQMWVTLAKRGILKKKNKGNMEKKTLISFANYFNLKFLLHSTWLKPKHFLYYITK